METRLGTKNTNSNGSNITLLDTLTDLQLKEYRNAKSELNDYENNERLAKIVLLNSQDYFRNTKELLADSTHKYMNLNSFNSVDQDFIYLSINRHFLNFLSSFRTFIDHSETILNRKYEKDSIQFQEFKKTISYYFDNSFAYRFFYKLRNYSQHCGLPIENILFTLNDIIDHKKTTAKLDIQFNSVMLLSYYKEWGSIVKKDLLDLNGDFEAHPLINEVTQIIKRISEQIESINYPKLQESINSVNHLARHLKTSDNEVSIFTNIQESADGKILNFNEEIIPFEIIDLIQIKLSKNYMQYRIIDKVKID